MKKRILLLSAVLITAPAFGFVNWEQTKTTNNKGNCEQVEPSNTADKPPYYLGSAADVYYDLSSRFGPITKAELAKATTVRDFFTAHVNKEIFGIESANIIIIKNDNHSNIQSANEGNQLTPAQRKLLSTCDYSTNLKISTDVKTKKGYGYYSPHLTVVPETQATYSLGKEAFIKYLEQENKKNTYGLDDKKLGFAKLTFRVNKDGNISDLNLDRTCGYKKIDNAMKELLKNTPGKWLPAVNAAGENVAQELVISFGKDGC